MILGQVKGDSITYSMRYMIFEELNIETLNSTGFR